jgi:HK97 family phage major capsid protein
MTTRPTELIDVLQALADGNANVRAMAERVAEVNTELRARVLDLEQRSASGVIHGTRAALGSGRSWGQTVAGSGELQRFVRDGVRGKLQVSVPALSECATITTGVMGGAGGAVAIDRDPIIAQVGRAPLGVRELLNPTTTNGSVVEFTRELVETNAASVVSEGIEKPQSNITFELKQAPTRTIAHWILASRQALEDATQLQAVIDTSLRYGLLIEEADQILNGDGTGQNLHGLIPQSTAFSAPFSVDDPSRFDVLLQAIAQSLETAQLPVTGILLNQIDLLSMMAIKDGQGRYVGGGPLSTSGGITRIWNVPAVGTSAMDFGDFLVGSFGIAGQLVERTAAEVLISTEDSDNFRKNLVTLLCEERVALVVRRPQSFIFGSWPSGVS